MKFKMMIGGVETLFPEAEIRYSKKTNEVIVFFLKIKKEYLLRTEKYIKKAEIKIEGDYLILKLKDFQYAYDLNKNKKLMQLYINGAILGFAFEDEVGKLLEIETPRYSYVI